MPDKEQTIPINMNQNSLVKGEIRSGVDLVSWDAIQRCNRDACPIGDTCEITTEDDETQLPCAVQVAYLQSFVEVVFRTYRGLDESDAYKVGMHLVPMYSQLCRLKILEKSVERVMYYDRHGNPGIHPVFKEIRDAMKTISCLWKDIGIKSGPPGIGDGAIPGNKGFGDPDHYADISKGANNKRDVTR